MKHLTHEAPELMDYQTLLFFPEVCNSVIIKEKTKLHKLLFKLLQLLHTAIAPMDFVSEDREDKDGEFPNQKQS